jgi:ArsR family transcriptional regulator
MPNLKDLDMMLSVIENPTRRRILEAIVREPHYPLQLSRELGMSQQAIMKHLKVLEDYALVRSFPEQSDQGGPSRKIYVPTTKFTIIVDFGPGLFDTTFVKLAMEAMQWPRLSNRIYEGPEELPDIGERVLEIREHLAKIDLELEALQRKREKLIERKEGTLEEAAGIIEGSVEDYQTRRIIYEFVQSPTLSALEIAEELGLRDRNVEDIIKKLKDQRSSKGGI